MFWDVSIFFFRKQGKHTYFFFQKGNLHCFRGHKIRCAGNIPKHNLSCDELLFFKISCVFQIHSVCFKMCHFLSEGAAKQILSALGQANGTVLGYARFFALETDQNSILSLTVGLYCSRSVCSTRQALVNGGGCQFDRSLCLEWRHFPPIG